MYSDMSKRRNSTPIAIASCRVTSVLPTPVGTCEQEIAERLSLIAQARARHLDRRGERLDRAILSEDHELEIALEVLQHLAVRGGDALRRDARHPRHHLFDVAHLDGVLALGERLQAQPRACFVDDVDRLVGQVALADVARGELGRGAHRIHGVDDAVVLLEAALQAQENLDGLLDRRLHDVDLLEAACEGVILLEDAAIFLIGRRADAAQLAVGQHGLDEVGGVHDAAGCGARADHRVNLVDEEDGARLLLQLRDDALQALLEVAAVLRAGDERPHVERDRPCSRRAHPAPCLRR
jgi:hypothetical protein